MSRTDADELTTATKKLLGSYDNSIQSSSILLSPPSLRPYVQVILDELKAIVPHTHDHDFSDFMLRYTEGITENAGRLHEDSGAVEQAVIVPLLGPGTIYAHAGELFQAAIGQALVLTGQAHEMRHRSRIPTLHAPPPGDSGRRLFIDIVFGKPVKARN